MRGCDNLTGCYRMEALSQDGAYSVDANVFAYIVEHCADAIVAVDGQQKIVLFNEAAEGMFGYPRDAVLGADLGLLLPRVHRKRHTALVDAFTEEGIAARYMGERGRQISGLRRDGTVFPAEISIMRSGAIDKPFMVSIIRDMSDHRHLERALQDLASTDSLTGVLNRRAFTERAESLLSAAGEIGRPLSVLLMDLDRFKNVNDTYGHAVGDLAIRQAINSFSECLRKSDVLGRWGGEEFVALLPQADAQAAVAIAERVRERIAEDRLFVADQRAPVTFTASLGVAERCSTDESLANLLERADKALYRAKHNGRNKVALAGEGEGE